LFEEGIGHWPLAIGEEEEEEKRGTQRGQRARRTQRKRGRGEVETLLR